MLSSSIRNTTANAASRLSSLTSQVRNSSTTTTMKEAIVSAGPSVKIIDSPIPKPNADQVVTKVIYSGSNPKDWQVTQSINNKHNI